MATTTTIRNSSELAALREEIRRISDSQRLILDELQILQTLVERLSERRAIPDIEYLSTLLPAVCGKYGSELWTVADLFSTPALAALIRDRSPGSVGMCLSRAAKRKIVIEGLIIERVDTEASAVLWRLLRVVSNH